MRFADDPIAEGFGIDHAGPRQIRNSSRDHPTFALIGRWYLKFTTCLLDRLGRVLHNWDLTTKKMLLRKAYQALPKGGAVIVYDMLIDDERRTAADGFLSSLNMLVWTAAGFGYSGTECTGWMREAGFGDLRVEPLVAGQSMVIGRK